MANEKDWRLQGQEKYLQGAMLSFRTYAPRRKNWEHDHCEFCGAKFSERPGELQEGYTTEDAYRWICKKCYEDFKEMFHWKADGDRASE